MKYTHIINFISRTTTSCVGSLGSPNLLFSNTELVVSVTIWFTENPCLEKIEMEGPKKVKVGVTVPVLFSYLLTCPPNPRFRPSPYGVKTGVR